MEYKLKGFEKVISVPKIANIHYFEFTNRYETVSDAHPFRELIYVDSGEIRVQSEGYSGLLRENQMIIHKALEPHSLSCSGDDSPNVIIIGFECDCDELDRFSGEPVTLSLPLQKTLTDIIREGRTVFLPPYDLPGVLDMKKREDYPFGADQMIQLKLESFLILLIRSETAYNTDEVEGANDVITEVYSYLKENYRENITLDELCFLYSTNKTSLCKQFRKAYGCTVIEFINKERIRRAKELIRKGKYSISEISQMTGFSSVHYFCRVFKQREQFSPTEYKKR